MATLIYIVGSPSVPGAIPITITNRNGAAEVVIESGPRVGATPAYIVPGHAPGTTEVRVVRKV